MRYISAIEFKKNLDYYIELSKAEDIYVTKDKHIITVLTNPDNYVLDTIAKMKGFLQSEEADGKTDEELITDSLMEKYGL